MPNDPKLSPIPDAGAAAGGLTLFRHLEELRGRIIKMSLAFALGFGVAWVFARAPASEPVTLAG